MISEEQQEIIRKILSPFEPEYIGIIGSYARGEEHPESDLDILVRFRKKLDLFDLVGLRLDLIDSLGIDVDLVLENSLHPWVRPNVERDLLEIT